MSWGNPRDVYDKININNNFSWVPITAGGGGGGPTPLRPMAKRFLAMGLSGPTFFIVSLAWKCDETNFKLLFRRKKISLKKK